jgi:hypothetical protein
MSVILNKRIAETGISSTPYAKGILPIPTILTQRYLIRRLYITGINISHAQVYQDTTGKVSLYGEAAGSPYHYNAELKMFIWSLNRAEYFAIVFTKRSGAANFDYTVYVEYQMLGQSILTA